MEQPLMPPPAPTINEFTRDRGQAPYSEATAVAALGRWLALLLAGWFATRVWCACGFACDAWNDAQGMEDLQMMFLYGTVLAWFTGLLTPRRNAFIFNRKRWYFFLVFAAASPAWTSLGYIDAFGSITPGASIYIIIATVLIGLFVLFVHIYLAVTLLPKLEIFVYGASRITVLGFYVVTVLIATRAHSPYEFHFHHYFIAWSLALFCKFDHWISVCTLAATTGVFVQWLGTSDFEPLFAERTRCVWWTATDGSILAGDFFAFTTRGIDNEQADSSPYPWDHATRQASGQANLEGNPQEHEASQRHPSFRMKACLVNGDGSPDLTNFFASPGLQVVVHAEAGEWSAQGMDWDGATTSSSTRGGLFTSSTASVPSSSSSWSSSSPSSSSASSPPTLSAPMSCLHELFPARACSNGVWPNTDSP